MTSSKYIDTHFNTIKKTRILKLNTLTVSNRKKQIACSTAGKLFLKFLLHSLHFILMVKLFPFYIQTTKKDAMYPEMIIFK